MPRTVRRSRFETTHWSLVQAAGGADGSHARAALAALCERYWYPLYAYVRRQGHDADAAQDLTQAFFVRFLDKRDVETARQDRGRFRSFLLASLQHFLQNDAQRRRALKRGAGIPTLSLEFEAGERRYVREPADRSTPETIFDRRWALTLLEHAFARVRREAADAGTVETFEALKPCLTGDSFDAGYRDLGRTLAMSEGAVKVAVHRLRRQFRRALRDEIAETVSSEAALEEEIRHLFSALARR